MGKTYLLFCFFIDIYAQDNEFMTSPVKAIVGEEFVLICKTSQSTVQYHNGGTGLCIVAALSDTDPTCRLISDACPTNFNYTCNQVSDEFTMTLPMNYNLEPLHNSKLRCDDGFGGFTSTAKTVYVIVPISNVSMTPSTTEIAVGNNQTFTCTTDAGRPNARIQWYMSNGTNVTDSASQQPSCEPGCNNKVNSESRLVYTGEMDDHGKTIHCTASNLDGRSVRSQNVIITIFYGPSSVALVPSTLSYTVTEGSSSVKPISCTADCRPDCAITWNGPNLPSGTKSVLNLQNITRNQSGDFQCTASNRVGSLTSGKVTFIVNYGPNSVIISPPALSYTVTETTDSVGPINCTANCRPNCTMVWSGPNLPGDTTSVLNLQNINRSQAGNYQCTASNSFGSLMSENILLVVNYGPSYVVVSPSIPSYTVTETIDSVGPITCKADCRPNCTMIWSGPSLLSGTTSVLNITNINRNQAGEYRCTANNSVGSLMSGVVTLIVKYAPSSVVLFPSTLFYTVTETTGSVGPINCTADCRPNCIMTWSGPNLPSDRTSVLNLQNINRNQKGEYQCTAENSIGSTKSVYLTVVVNYGPSSVMLFPSTPSYTVTEITGSVGPINCAADCTPNCTMTWNGTNLLSSTVSDLHLQNINRNQTGDYFCTASNSIGSLTSSRVTVIVNYVPTISIIEGNTNYTENDTAVLRCNVDSIPKSIIIWKFMDGNISKILSKEDNPNYIVNGSHLQVNQMDCLSMGQYICEAKNDIGKTNETLYVSVLCAPRLNTIEYEIPERIAVKDNEPLNITVPVLAYPTPWTSWRLIQNDSFSNKAGKIEYTDYKNRYFSILFIQNMTQDDFGTYAIYAGNGLVKDTWTLIGSFEVNAARKPVEPSNITCSAGYNYIVVNWQPEYNGGSLQNFQVLYRHYKEDHFKDHKDNVSEADYHPVKISNLQSSNMYLLKVHASNIYNTTASDEIRCNTTREELGEAESLIDVGVGAGVGSAVVAISVVLVAFLIFRRLRTNTSKNDREPMKRSNEEEDDELKDNPLYVSSAEDALPQSGTCSQVWSGKKLGKNNKPIEMGCVYENHDDFMKGNDQIYANQLDTENNTNDYNPKQNKDGLIYADLDLAPVSEERRFVIRGIDCRNNYAIIDLSKTADPLPSDDEDEERKNLEVGK